MSVIQGTAEPFTQLGKSLRPRHVTMITIGGIIGAGLFVGSSASIATTGPAIILSYGMAGLVMLVVMRMLSEMAVAHPHIGAFTEFAREGLGNWAGFTNGWLYWFSWAIIAAIEALAGARIIHDWAPEFPIWVIGWSLLAALTGVNLLSTRSYGEFEFWFASIKVAAIIVFILLGLAFVLGHDPMTQVSHLHDHGGFAPFGPVAVFGGVVSVIQALSGGEIATIAAAEGPDAARTVSRMTGQVTVRIMLFYIGSISLIVMIVPWNQIHPGVSPFTTTLETMHIPAAAFGMKLIVLTAVLSCLNSSIYVTSRVLFTLSAQGDAPKALVRLNARRVPMRAILFSSLFGYVAVFASVVSPERVFAFLINASGSVILMIYIITALAQIRLRRGLERTAPERLTLKVWFFPWLSYATVAAMAAVMGAMLFIPQRRPEVISGLICLGGALALYGILRRGRDKPATAG